MGTYIKRKYSYPVLMVINIVMASVRLKVFPYESALYHITLSITALFLIFLGWEGTLLIHRLLEHVIPINKKPLLKISVQIFIATFLNIFLSYFIFFSANTLFDVGITPLWDSVIYLMNFFLSVIFNLVIFGAYYFYQWKNNLINKSNLEKEQAIVKYDALRNQLNPHFLFNALTSLNSLIFENQQLASDFLQQLSKVYRYTLQNRDKEAVSIRTELNFVQHYISLMKTRFGEAIQFIIKVDEVDMEKGIVPVLSQMLIENAVKHNSVSLENPLRISISSDGVYFIVENNINKKAQVETSNKLGVQNMKDLYKYLTNRSVEVENTETHFVVKIPLIV
ncbi:sensor histidine kinase [Mariniflexile gromovii]|uniref:Histidine kinase n=1 Tax=Mariniflexile gromovii TaxID=362523 RepID=A0ABS4BQ07_9FLAO|nr:sensor histidine kinase [Mariniflexile gromovii]MBP0902669.1 histidine kinase [Mariniflexile gromovii]